MPKYRVRQRESEVVTYEVEADDEDQAWERFVDDHDSVTEVDRVVDGSDLLDVLPADELSLSTC